MVAYTCTLYLKHMHVIVIDANFLRNSVLYLPINRHKSNFISVNQTQAVNYLHHSPVWGFTYMCMSASHHTF